MKLLYAATVLLCAAACTPGASAPPAGGGGAATSVDVNLSAHAAAASPFGTVGGYAPAVTSVAVGTTIRFVNSDSFAHTATLIPGATFPSGSPFSSLAQNASGTPLSQPWSTGTLSAGAASQTFVADRAGTYLYGCFFHYGAPMRGAIVAQ